MNTTFLVAPKDHKNGFGLAFFVFALPPFSLSTCGDLGRFLDWLFYTFFHVPRVAISLVRVRDSK
jgi:hypothetical protein